MQKLKQDDIKQSDWVVTLGWVFRKDFREEVIFKLKPG